MAEATTASAPSTYIMSAWGRKLIAMGDHVFRKQKALKDKSYWTCVAEGKQGCKARIHVLEDNSAVPTIIYQLGTHNHEPNIGQVERRYAVNKMKAKALESDEPSGQIIRKVLSTEPELPIGNKERVKATLRRTRRRSRRHQQIALASLPSEGSSDREDVNPGDDIDKVIIELGSYSKKRKLSNAGGSASLQGKVTLITGASSGIGEAIAETLARAGAIVCIAARRLNRLSVIHERIEYEGGIVHAFSLDVTNRLQFMDVVETIERHIGPIEVLVNNAGVMYYTHMHNAMVDDWDQMIDVNCRGVTNGLACVLPRMVQRCEGHIVNMSSDAGRKGFAGIAVYSGTKYFIEGLSQSLRQEVKDKNIRVTCIQPGDVSSELTNYVKDNEAVKKYGKVDQEKILDPEDVARAVLYAVSQPTNVGVNEILIEPQEFPI